MLATKSGQSVRPYSTSVTLFLLFVQQTCHNIARISSMSLVHGVHGWAIPQDNRMVYVAIKRTEKLLHSLK